MSNAIAKSGFSLNTTVLPATVLILSGLSFFYSLRGSDVTPTLPVSTDSTAIAQRPQSPPQPMLDSVGDLVAAHARLRPAFSPATDAGIAPMLTKLHKNTADIRAEQANRDRLVAELDRQHKAESIDTAWSAQSETAILSTSIDPLMSQSGLMPKDLSADCRSSTCRISARFAESTDAQSWATMMVTQMAGTMSQARMAVMQLPDGSSEVRIYGARKQSLRG